jgi:hypothetical protein
LKIKVIKKFHIHHAGQGIITGNMKFLCRVTAFAALTKELGSWKLTCS